MNGRKNVGVDVDERVADAVKSYAARNMMRMGGAYDRLLSAGLKVETERGAKEWEDYIEEIRKKNEGVKV